MTESKSDVSIRHRMEWRAFRESYLNRCMNDIDPDLAKAAKALADLLKVYQEGERKAYDFTEGNTDHNNELQISWE